jgi:uncharacterized protein YjbI with pentapeptide repeats
MLSGLCLPLAAAAGTCQVEQSASGPAPTFKTHLSADCTEQERQARVVQAQQILTAIKQGKAIDLSGVVVQGDLHLEDLPIGPLPKELDRDVPGAGTEVRVALGAFSLVNSVVRGAIQYRSAQGLLVMNGPVTFSGTTFAQPVDLSRTVFTQPVTLSGAIFLKEAYFVQARFLHDVFAEKTAFGPHTRFHRAMFRGSVTFQQSGFSGLAEFLEIEFDRDVNLSRTYFKLGTGFSGSHFRGMADFSEALFDREAFFTFTRFDGDAFFRRATFRSTADFDDAEFKARDDFSKALFEGGSKFARVKRPADEPAALGVENPQVQYAITLSLLVFSALLIAYLVRSR